MERKKRNHNEGSIRERADGRFEIRVTAGYDFETGKSKRISYYTKTKAEAIQKLHEEEYKIHFQKHVDPTSTTFLDWLWLWLETYMKNKVKQSTYVSYRGYIENHLAPAFPTLKLKDLTTKLLQDFYNYKQNTQGLSPKTILNLHRCLHKAMNQACWSITSILTPAMRLICHAMKSHRLRFLLVKNSKSLSILVTNIGMVFSFA